MLLVQPTDIDDLRTMIEGWSEKYDLPDYEVENTKSLLSFVRINLEDHITTTGFLAALGVLQRQAEASLNDPINSSIGETINVE